MTQHRSDLTVRDLSAGYGSRDVLRGLSLPPLKTGHVTVLVGPNGAGKTTLLRALAGLIPATGNLFYGEKDLLTLTAAERASIMAFMPQFVPQRMALTVLEACISALRVSPPAHMQIIDSTAFRDTALDTLEQLGIIDLASQSLDRLSGGQRQLASLAQALVRRPRLLLLDEPISALDLRHQIEVMQIIREIANAGTAVVTVLHDLQVAARWADVVIVLKNGALQASGSPRSVIDSKMLRHVYDVDAVVEVSPGGDLHVNASKNRLGAPFE